MTFRLVLPNRRNHVTQKVKVAGQNGPLIKSPVEALSQITQQQQSAAKADES